MAEKRDYLRKYQTHRYQAKRFRNPYFQAPKKRLVLRGKQWLVVITTLAATVGCAYLIGFAPFWMIQASRIEGLQFMNTDEITQTVENVLNGRRWLIFPTRNRLFFRSAALVDELNKQFSFESLSVTVAKKTVLVQIKERVSQVIWMTDGAAYYTDVEGTVIRALSESDVVNLVWHGSTQPSLSGQVMEGPYPHIAALSTLPLIQNKEGKEAEPGDQVMTPGGIAGIIAMNGLLAEAGLPVKDFLVERADSVWVSARLVEGFDVLFDTSVDARSQVGYLTDVLQKSVPDRSTLDYVDVRFGNHVYFKNK